jgi:hypothetical protein
MGQNCENESLMCFTAALGRQSTNPNAPYHGSACTQEDPLQGFKKGKPGPQISKLLQTGQNISSGFIGQKLANPSNFLDRL